MTTPLNHQPNNNGCRDITVIIAAIIGATATIIAAFGYRIIPLLNPTVVIRNDLEVPIRVYVDETPSQINNYIYDSEIPAHTEARIRIDQEPVAIRIEVTKRTDNKNQVIGHDFEEIFTRVYADKPLVIDNKIELTDSYYFYPLLTNNTNLDCQIWVNDGNDSEAFVGTLKAHQTNVALGYYHWYENSNVTVNCNNKLVWWGLRYGEGKKLSSFPQDPNGVFRLTLNESSLP